MVGQGTYESDLLSTVFLGATALSHHLQAGLHARALRGVWGASPG